MMFQCFLNFLILNYVVKISILLRPSSSHGHAWGEISVKKYARILVLEKLLGCWFVWRHERYMGITRRKDRPKSALESSKLYIAQWEMWNSYLRRSQWFLHFVPWLRILPTTLKNWKTVLALLEWAWQSIESWIFRSLSFSFQHLEQFVCLSFTFIDSQRLYFPTVVLRETFPCSVATHSRWGAEINALGFSCSERVRANRNYIFCFSSSPKSKTCTLIVIEGNCRAHKYEIRHFCGFPVTEIGRFWPQFGLLSYLLLHPT